MFGLAFLATRRLALPIGIHFGANVVYGNVLGFAVSGTDNHSISPRPSPQAPSGSPAAQWAWKEACQV
jgi:hypothetical protein